MTGPKKPSTAFIIFTNSERGKILAELGSLKIGELGKELGRRWRELTVEEREEYQARAEEDKLRYKEDLKKLKGKLPPKKPLTSYLEFAKLERARVSAELGPSLQSEIEKEIGGRWKVLPKIQKEVFEDKARKSMEKYVQELALFSSEEIVSSPPVQEQPQCSSTSQHPSQCSTAAATPLASSQTLQTTPQDTPTSQGPLTALEAPPQFSPTSQAASPSQSGVSVSDLGFAKQRFYPWHPALKTGELGRGSRVTVTYFGCGESGTVDKKKWVPYSEQAAARICSPNMMKKTSFSKGLEQLKTTLSKIQSGNTSISISSAVGSARQPVGRKLVKLDKEGLQKDEEQNLRLMKDKMVMLEKGKWGCRDCTWTGKYAHKAKCHARDCGARRRENPRKPKATKYECSRDGCDLTFPYLGQLQAHYRYCGRISHLQELFVLSSEINLQSKISS